MYFNSTKLGGVGWLWEVLPEFCSLIAQFTIIWVPKYLLTLESFIKEARFFVDRSQLWWVGVYAAGVTALHIFLDYSQCLHSSSSAQLLRVVSSTWQALVGATDSGPVPAVPPSPRLMSVRGAHILGPGTGSSSSPRRPGSAARARVVPGPVIDTPSDPADARSPAACAAGTAVAQVRLRMDHALLLSLSVLALTRRASVEAEPDFSLMHATVGSERVLSLCVTACLLQGPFVEASDQRVHDGKLSTPPAPASSDAASPPSGNGTAIKSEVS